MIKPSTKTRLRIFVFKWRCNSILHLNYFQLLYFSIHLFVLDGTNFWNITHFLNHQCASRTETCRQFHQHFTCAFFIRKIIAQLFFSYILALAKGFWREKALLYEKRARKMLMKLTPGLTTIENRAILHQISIKSV